MSGMAVKAVNRTKEVVVVETEAEQVKGECQVLSWRTNSMHMEMLFKQSYLGLTTCIYNNAIINIELCVN